MVLDVSSKAFGAASAGVGVSPGQVILEAVPPLEPQRLQRPTSDGGTPMARRCIQLLRPRETRTVAQEMEPAHGGSGAGTCLRGA